MQVLLETYATDRKGEWYLTDVIRYPSYFCADVALLEHRKFQLESERRIREKYERKLMVNVLDLEDEDYTDSDPQEWLERFERFFGRNEVSRIVPDDGETNAPTCTCGRDSGQCLFARWYGCEL